MASASIDQLLVPAATVPARSHRAWLPMPVLLVVWAFALVAATVALFQPFPTAADELEHLSMVRTQYERPAVFPDYTQAKILRRDDLRTFSADHNYINHPSLYYWLMAQVMRVSDGVSALRLANVALAVLALLVTVWAGTRVFADTTGRTIYAVIAACFPKAAPVAGMINNDNLAALSGACVFAGVVGTPGAAWWLAGGLAIAGWSKLTALIALGAVVVGERGWRWWTGESPLLGRDTAIIFCGGALGAVPYIANLLTLGVLVPVDAARYFVTPEHRVPLDLAGFASYFFDHLASKWPASEAALPLSLAAIVILAPVICAALGFARVRGWRGVAAGYAVGLLVTLTAHFWFGWRSYALIGDLTIAQTRYYNVLWPGLAMGGALLIAAIRQRSRWTAGGLLALYLYPTALGAILASYF